MKAICFLMLVLEMVAVSTGCNTVRGMGEDVEDVGDAVKDATN